MSAVLQRSFRILEELACAPEGKTLTELVGELGLPLSATHRLLTDLIKEGLVRKDERRGEFSLTMKMPSLGLRFLIAGGVVDIAQPILERLAMTSGELVRLAIVEDEQLIYVAKAQANVQLATTELTFTAIKAPFAGTIVRVDQKVGNQVKEGEVLAA